MVLFDFEIAVENVVMIGSFSESVNLSVASLKLEGSMCNWQKFSGLSFKLKSSLATFLLFKNGHFVCTGTKTKTKAKEATTTFLDLLKAEGLVSNQCTFECRVKNLVASINIEGASVPIGQFTNDFEAIYDPDKIPTVSYKSGEPQATVMGFLTGKIICSGAADEETLKQTIQKLLFATSETH